MSFQFFDSLPSTMEEARVQASQGAEEGTVIVAYEQTQGRGRQGRRWESERGNLYMTVITYLDVPLSQAPQLSFVSCVAIGEALCTFLSPLQRLTYKWPNDLLLNGKKVGGLLLEVLSLPEKGKTAYLIGCGVNLTLHPKKSLYPATSFQQEGIYISLEDVLPKLTTSLEKYRELWLREGFSPIRELWLHNILNLGKIVTVHVQGKDYTGLLKGIDEAGSLILETSEGHQKFSAGDILEGGLHASRH